MSRDDRAENKQTDHNIPFNAIATVCRFLLLVCITHFRSLQILGVKDQDLGSGEGMDGKKKRFAIHRPSAARASFQVAIIKKSTSMHIKNSEAN